MTVLFLTVLTTWGLLSLLRFVRMYDHSSIFQRWRRFDVLHLVPRGALFSPQPPALEQALLVRDVVTPGLASTWTEVAATRRRRLIDAVWNPRKPVYRARLQLTRELLVTASEVAANEGHGIPVQLVFSEHYLQLLQYVSRLDRVTPVAATQFGIIERDVLTRQPKRYLVSALHER